MVNQERLAGICIGAIDIMLRRGDSDPRGYDGVFPELDKNPEAHELVVEHFKDRMTIVDGRIVSVKPDVPDVRPETDEADSEPEEPEAVEPAVQTAPAHKRPVFVEIAAPLIERGFRVTPVHPETKMGVMRNWQNWQITSQGQLKEYSETGSKSKYAHHNVGVVSKRGWTTNADGTEDWRLCFLDVDSPGVVERIEAETSHKMPAGYKVKSSPNKKPYKTHFYFYQTKYSFEQFGGWQSVNVNRKDMTAFDEEGKHPTLYDLKAIGGGSLVVGAGSCRDDGQVYTCVDDGPVPDLPDWLTDWLVKDIEKYWDDVDADRAKKLAAKEAERNQYTPVQRAEMRRKGLPEGFDIHFEDAYGYLFSRACELSGIGISGQALEAALTQLLEKDVAGGKEYAQTDKGKSMLTKLAYDSNLEPGNASWFYRRKEKRPFRTGDKSLIYFTHTRRMAMVEVMKTFPPRLHRKDAYTRLEAELSGRFPFDRTDNTCQQDITRARKDAGITLEGHWWVRPVDSVERR